MATGFKCYSDGGTVQISEDYLCYAMTAKGSLTLTLDPTPHPNPVYQGSVTVTGTAPIIAIRAEQPCCVVGISNSGSTWTFNLRGGVVTTPVDYYVFDEAANAPESSDNFGLKVWRADGSLAFHSSTKVLRAVDFIDLPEPSDGWDGDPIQDADAMVARTYEPGRLYAIIQVSACFAFEKYNSPLDHGPLPGGFPPQKWMDMRGWQSASFIDNGPNAYVGLSKFEDWYDWFISVEPQTRTRWGSLGFLVVDVTNY